MFFHFKLLSENNFLYKFLEFPYPFVVFFIFRQGKVLNCYTSRKLPQTLRQLGVLKIL